MRILISLVLLVGGFGLSMLSPLARAFAQANAIKIYNDQVAAAPVKETYTRAEYTSAAWQAWTNRVHLPVKESYSVAELKDSLFGLGTSQNSCDRLTYLALIRDAAGKARTEGDSTTGFGIVIMLIGSGLLGTALGRQAHKKSEIAENS